MTTLSKSEYLQRYLSSGNEEKKIKKKKKSKEKSQQRPSGLRIVEDDAFIAVSAKYKDVDTDEEKEDIEIIASISRQLEAKAREGPKFLKSFKPLDGAADVKTEIKSEVLSDDDCPSTSQASRKDNVSDTATKAQSTDTSKPQDARTRHDSERDQSPRRRRHDSDNSPARKRHDSDQSPPRRRHDSDDSDLSPVRRRRDSSKSSARMRHNSSTSPTRRRSDSDQSPPRHRHRSKDISLSATSKSPERHDTKSNHSSSRRKKESGSRRSSDPSPPRKRAHRRRDSDPNRSPPRGHEKSTRPIKVEVDSDQSPERRERRRRSSSSDLSPPRKPQRSSLVANVRRRRDSDESPPRRREQFSRGRERRIASPEKLGKELQKTLDGKVAGLQSADALKKESEKLREREAKVFEEMDASISGRFAETTVREKQVRKKREKPEDKERKEREARKQAELQEKYDLWNKGVAQKERREEQLEEMARVAAEPLARMADDVAMNRHLKDLIHEEDPMAQMLMSKKREKAIDRGELVYPTYQGEAPPNRFGIRPGYRWDGVDRSNGFEATLAQTKNRRNAQEKEYYQHLQMYE